MLRLVRALFAFPIMAVFLASGVPAFGATDIGVNLNINLGPPPVLVAPPPELVLIPETGVYFIPDAGADIFFYSGFWWAPRGPNWYRADSPRGPWIIMEVRSVPPPLIRVPRDYRVVYGRAERIPYGQWKKDHGDHWGKKKHGHRDD